MDLDNLEDSIAEVVTRIEELLRPFAAELELVCGIPGVKQSVGAVLLSEIGVEMRCFASPGHLACWARLAPPNNESAGKRRGARWSGRNRWLRGALIQVANAAAHKRPASWLLSTAGFAPATDTNMRSSWWRVTSWNWRGYCSPVASLTRNSGPAISRVATTSSLSVVLSTSSNALAIRSPSHRPPHDPFQAFIFIAEEV